MKGSPMRINFSHEEIMEILNAKIPAILENYVQETLTVPSGHILVSWVCSDPRDLYATVDIIKTSVLETEAVDPTPKRGRTKSVKEPSIVENTPIAEPVEALPSASATPDTENTPQSFEKPSSIDEPLEQAAPVSIFAKPVTSIFGKSADTETDEPMFGEKPAVEPQRKSIFSFPARGSE